MKNTLLSIFLAFTAATALPAQEQKFTVSGNIGGLEKGDTLRFRQIILPGWKDGDTFDVVLKKDGKFKYKGIQRHDMYYIMEYHPVNGSAPACDRTGKTMIIAGNDHIRISGSKDYIYYSTLEGGVYDDPALAEYLAVEDSVGAARGDIMRRIEEANAAKDYDTSKKLAGQFNSFYNGNPGVSRSDRLREAYFKDNPQGNNYILVERISRMDNQPIDKLREAYEAYSQEVKDSHYGRIYAHRMKDIEAIAVGNQAPDFSLILTDGRIVKKNDFKGKYLLLFHWGTCPGSMQIDPEVQALYREYKDSGLCIIGLTESIENFRSLAESVPEGSSASYIGIDDLHARLEEMLSHPWPEAETKTNHPENERVSDIFMISGLPYFVFIGPDGAILARDYHPAFYEARKILEEQAGE